MFGWVFLSLVLILPITLSISTSITNPLTELKSNFALGATGNFLVRMNPWTQDEAGELES